MNNSFVSIPTEELHKKLFLGEFIIGQIEHDPDPRAPAAVERLKSEMKQIEEELQKRFEGKPEPQVVGLKSVALRAFRGA